MRPPVSVYRVQVRPDFDLAATAQLADYLARLGVTHLYSAPLLEATSGSPHGYDVVDHSRVGRQLGGEEARRALVAALRQHDLGLVADIVPNHCGVRDAAANPAWWDVLRLGRESPYAAWFDIDWSRGRIVLPVLGDEPDALDDLVVADDELRYHERRFPIAPGTATGTPREVHSRQHYELVSWRRGDAEVNYRRFFAITDLAGLRVEDPGVFDATHRELLRWVAAGEVDGIRVDHPDGLRDPAGYLGRLRDVAPAVWLVVEKILETGEHLPPWPVAGTTGYDALGDVCGLFVDPAGESHLTTLAADLTGATASWSELVHDTKHDVATRMLCAELSRLTRLMSDVDDTFPEALAEVAACFPVYRSYLPYGAGHLREAVAEAQRRRPDLVGVCQQLAVRLADPADELALRFQQYTGAVMAKGVEDTAYYRFSRFVALNEVGGDPARFGVAPEEFHAACAARHEAWPAGMTTLSTHDTKRSEDVRARLAVLSELPREWAQVVRELAAGAAPADPSLAYLLWQTAIGSWPIERERLRGYAEKAAREAGRRTTWADPDERFEASLASLVDAMYQPPIAPLIDAFVARIVRYGWSNSLGQKVVQLTMPGVPDTYQGCELWDNSLVDPDNRRPVDFGARRHLLAKLDEGWLPPIDATGAVKLLVTSRALRVRRDRPELFDSYTPCRVEGPGRDHVVAFDRGGAVTVATRLPARLDRCGGFGGTVLPLPPGEWTDALTGRVHGGGSLPVSAVLDRYPVAVLVRS